MGIIKDYDYKKSVHKLWKRFIRENLDVPRKQMRALCFPSKYAREVENTYYKLGMLPENIVGVEKDKETADYLRETQQFGVENCDLLDYVKRTDKKFHIISLDYTGYLTDKERDIFRIIGKRGLLEDNAVILTNFSGRRESRKQQEKYQRRMALTELNSRLRDSISSPSEFGHNLSDDIPDLNSPDKFTNITPRDLENIIKGDLMDGLAIKPTKEGLVIVAPGLIEEADGEELKELIEGGAVITDSAGNSLIKTETDKEKMRDMGIPQEVFYSLIDYSYENMRDSEMVRGFLDFYDPELLEKTISEKSFLSANRELLDSTFPLRYPTSNRDKINVSEESKRKFMEKYADNTIFQRMFEWICFRSFKWHPQVTHLARLYQSEIFIPQKIELYRYVSDDGTPMNCDFWSLENIKKVIPEIKKYADDFYKFPMGWAVTEEVRKHVTTSKRGLRDMKAITKVVRMGKNPAEILFGNSVLDLVQDHAKRHEKLGNKVGYQMNLLETGENDRVFFGSFYKPRAKHKEVAKMLIQENTDQEIYDQYRIGKMELAGVKAALTRGSYEDLKIELGKEESKKTKIGPRLEVKLNKIKEPKQNTENLSLIPKKYERELSNKNRISKNMKLRMNYFLKDTRNLEHGKKQTLCNSISESNWFRGLDNGVSDLEVYAFFDDIMLNFVHQKKHIKPEKIRSLWDKIRSADKLYETIPLSKKPSKQPKKVPKKEKLSDQQNQEIYKFILEGLPDEEIMQTYNLTKQQLAARKAWITMRNK